MSILCRRGNGKACWKQEEVRVTLQHVGRRDHLLRGTQMCRNMSPQLMEVFELPGLKHHAFFRSVLRFRLPVWILLRLLKSSNLAGLAIFLLCLRSGGR